MFNVNTLVWTYVFRSLQLVSFSASTCDSDIGYALLSCLPFDCLTHVCPQKRGNLISTHHLPLPPSRLITMQWSFFNFSFPHFDNVNFLGSTADSKNCVQMSMHSIAMQNILKHFINWFATIPVYTFQSNFLLEALPTNCTKERYSCVLAQLKHSCRETGKISGQNQKLTN